jgi:hypothetical protein
MSTKFWLEYLEGRDQEIRWEYVDRIHESQHRDQCEAVVNTVMKLRVL